MLSFLPLFFSLLHVSSTSKIFSFPPVYFSLLPSFPHFSNVAITWSWTWSISNTDTHEDTQPVIKLANQHRLMTRNNVGHGCTVSFIFQPGEGEERKIGCVSVPRFLPRTSEVEASWKSRREFSTVKTSLGLET